MKELYEMKMKSIKQKKRAGAKTAKRAKPTLPSSVVLNRKQVIT